MNWIASTLAWACLIGTLAACCPARPEPVLPPESESEPQPQPTAMPNETPADPGPPKARREDVVDEIHGVRVADPYRWLEDGDAPEVKEWLKAHDDYAHERLEAAPERDALVARLKELSYIDWVSSPRRHGDRYFFSRRHKDKEKVVYYWRQGKDGEPKVLIDPNTLSEDGSI